MTHVLEAHSQESRAFIVLIKTPPSDGKTDLGQRFLLPWQGGLSVGSHVDANVYLHSQLHPFSFELVYSQQYWTLYNKGPSDTISINRFPVNKYILEDGDVIDMGDHSLEFCLSDGVRAAFFEKNEGLLREDVLTKAVNRGTMLQYLEHDLRRYTLWEEERRINQTQSPHPPMSLILFDIDHFKQFNDQYDHLVGDQVLKSVVSRIKGRVRVTDVVGRYAGEEFLVYLPGTAYDQAMEIAEQLRGIIAETPFQIGLHKPMQITISLGVAQFTPNMNVETFVQAADRAMFTAKRAGRNRVVGNQDKIT